MGTTERFGELLDSYLRRTGLSQAQFAAKIGRSKDWLNQRLPQGWRGHRYEKKRLGLEADDIPMLADALGVPTTAFFEEPQPEIAPIPGLGEGNVTPEPSEISIVFRALSREWHRMSPLGRRRFIHAILVWTADQLNEEIPPGIKDHS